jgi:hypothetical protein
LQIGELNLSEKTIYEDFLREFEIMKIIVYLLCVLGVNGIMKECTNSGNQQQSGSDTAKSGMNYFVTAGFPRMNPKVTQCKFT